MEEQRYVVEITRPVPPDKVAQVAERIAARLNVPHERIVTLLDGRTGEVTKPVLADKADAIAEVFAEAGVRVVIAAARLDPPPYEERFGEPPQWSASRSEQQEPEPPEAAAAERMEPEDDEAPLAAEEETIYEAADENEVDSPPPWDEVGAWEFGEPHDDFGYGYAEPAAEQEPPLAEPDEQEVGPSVETDAAAGYAAADSPEEEDDGTEAATSEAQAEYDAAEEEADRLGPAPRMRVEVEPRPQGRTGPPEGRGGPRGEHTASTRWTPSPHDPYAFAPEDAAATGGERPSPMGPARATPLDARPQEGRADYEPHPVGGFYSPDDDPPREGPRLRSYLLWALGISILVLILLQFVLASRVGGAVGGASYESGLTAYRVGDFAAARRAWEPLAAAGHADAQYLLGFMAQNGLGQPWSNAAAANWYRQAAHQGHPRAQLALGDLYLRGMGVDQDLGAGAAWYASAAIAGDAEGQFEYAKLVLHGVGVDRDLRAALAWFEAAAANGSAPAADFVEFARLPL